MKEKIPKKEIEKDLNTAKKLEAIANQEGGKHLIKLSAQDVVTAIDTIAGNYKTLSHTEFIAQACRLHERLNMYRLLTGAKKNVDVIEQALREAEEDTD